MRKLLSMLLIAALALGLPTAAGAAEEEALAVPVSSTLEPSAEIGLPDEPEASGPPAEDDGFVEAAAEDNEEAASQVAAPSGEIALGDAEAAGPLAIDGDAEAASETGEIIERAGLTYRIEGGAATVIGSSEDLVDVVIPEQIDGVPVVCIGESAFMGHAQLQSVTIPASVAAIQGSSYYQGMLGPAGYFEGGGAFFECTGLVTVIFAEGAKLVSVGNLAFYNTAIREIELPPSVEEIGVAAFAKCGKLQKISIMSAVPKLAYTFMWCASLTEVKLADDQTEIAGSHAFAYCKALKTIQLPAGLTVIGVYAFYSSGLKEIKLPDGLLEVADAAFCDCQELRTLSFPDSVRVIGNNVCNACVFLTKVHLPEGLKRIEHHSFASCVGLTEINIPSGLTSIGISAFQSCIRLRSAIIPDSVEEIGSQAFCRCSALRTVRLSPNVRVLEEGVFAECTALETITVPEGVEIIKGGVLYGCNKLKTVQLPASLRAIDEVLFPACDSVAGVDFAGTKAEWRSLTINHADPSLCDVTVRCADGDCTVVGEGCCGSQWYLFKDGSMDFVWNVDYGENRMEDHSLDSLPSWLDEWFLNMTDSGKITELRFHEGVPVIGDYAFTYSAVKTVTLSKDIRSIGQYAFGSCTDLTDVYYEGDEAQWAEITIGTGNDALKRAKIHYGEAPGVRGLPGDADGNGCIDEHDLHALLRFLAMETFFVRHTADLTGNGIVDREDLLPLVTLLRDQMTAENTRMLLKEGFTYEAAWALRYTVGQTPA